MNQRIYQIILFGKKLKKINAKNKQIKTTTKKIPTINRTNGNI